MNFLNPAIPNGHNTSRRPTPLDVVIDRDIVHPRVLDDIEHQFRQRKLWKRISEVTEGLAHIFLGVNAILAFTAGVYELRILLFFAGFTSTVSIVLLKYSVYAAKECEQRHTIINNTLEHFHASTVPPVLDSVGHTSTPTTP